MGATQTLDDNRGSVVDEMVGLPYATRIPDYNEWHSGMMPVSIGDNNEE